MKYVFKVLKKKPNFELFRFHFTKGNKYMQLYFGKIWKPYCSLRALFVGKLGFCVLYFFFFYFFSVRVSRAQRVNKSLDFSAISAPVYACVCLFPCVCVCVCVQTLTVYMAAKFQEFSQQNCQRNYINIAGGESWRQWVVQRKGRKQKTSQAGAWLRVENRNNAAQKKRAKILSNFRLNVYLQL